MAQNKVDKLLLISENCKKYPMRLIETNKESEIFQVTAHINIRDKTMIQQMLQTEVPMLSNHVYSNKRTFWKV